MAAPDKATARTPSSPRLKPLPAELPEVESFFRSAYRDLLRYAMYVGATKQEGDDAVMATMEDLLLRWTRVDNPLAYARKAVVSNFLKEKERGLDRVRRRQIERDGVALEEQQDNGLSAWEDRQWVAQMLESLTPAQREVMALILDGLDYSEIAGLLGKTPEAIRRNLCDARKRLTAALDQERMLEQTYQKTSLTREEA